MLRKSKKKNMATMQMNVTKAHIKSETELRNRIKDKDSSLKKNIIQRTEENSL